MNYEIYFQAYHEGDMWNLEDFNHGLFRPRRIWDDYRDRNLLEEAGVDRPTIGKFYQARALLESTRGVKADPGPYCTILRDFPPLDSDNNPADVYMFSFTAIKIVREEIVKWLRRKISAGNETGADDGTFDYYPDIWYIGHQLAHALSIQEDYRQLRQQLLDTTQYGEADLGEYIPDCPAEEHEA